MAIGSSLRRRFPRGIAGSLAVAFGVSFVGCFAGPSPAPSGGTAAPSPTFTATPLDLGPVGNVAIADYQGIPTGEQELGGVAFRVGDSAIRVGSRSFPDFPRGVTGIPVGRSFRVARFLHATNGGTYQQPGHPKHEFDGVHVGDYVVRYEDGTSETIQLRYGHELRDWWNWDGSLPATNATVAWTGENPGAAKYDVKVRLYATSWLNPHPDKKVATIDLVSANAKAAPFCAAITVDDDPSFVPSTDATPPSVAPQASAAPVNLATRTPDTSTSPTESVAASENTESPAPEPTDEPQSAQTPTAPEPSSPAGDVPSAEPAPAGESTGLIGLLDGSEDASDEAEEEKEKPDFLGPPPSVWNVVVDPAESLPEYPEKLPYARLEGIRPPRILTPATPSPFIGLEEGDVDVTGFRVVDLRTGETVAAVDGMNVSKSAELATGPALSPDGRLTAIFDFSSQSIYVGDLQKRKTQNRFPWEGSDPVLLFAKADTLVAIEPSQRPRVEVWQLPLGARVAAFELEGSPELNPPLVAISPGGRFLALCVGSGSEVATFYDLTTGKEAGTLRSKGRTVDAYFLAFGFSPDGREFAGFMNGLENQGQPAGIHSGVIVWDVETGRPIYQSEYEYDGFEPSAGPISDRPLQWFPDGKGWLLTQSRLFDRESGRVVRSLTEHMSLGKETTGAQVLDDQRLLISDASGSAMTIIENVREAPAKEE